jgi:glutamine amidotransferase
LSGAPERIRATFWLLEAPDSLVEQSRRQPDGTGLGTFDPDCTPRVEKSPIAAYQDEQFAQAAKHRTSITFNAHVRYASTGARNVHNTHPFEQHSRLFAHNGVIGDLPKLERELGTYCDLVHGDTDSERLFALITKRIDAAGGDVSAGITNASRWAAANLPLFSINMVLTTCTDMWALRYPESHDLLVLQRRAGGGSGSRQLDHTSASGRIRVRSPDLADRPAVVVASERMDEDSAWRSLAPGELMHVDRQLGVHCTIAVDHEPAHRLNLADLGHAAVSQSPDTAAAVHRH